MISLAPIFLPKLKYALFDGPSLQIATRCKRFGFGCGARTGKLQCGICHVSMSRVAANCVSVAAVFYEKSSLICSVASSMRIESAVLDFALLFLI
jgi:hypothetical protein